MRHVNLLSDQSALFYPLKINVNLLAQVCFVTLHIRRAMQLLSLGTQVVFYLVDTFFFRLGNKVVMGKIYYLL